MAECRQLEVRFGYMSDLVKLVCGKLLRFSVAQ